jgi:hypothetical protein
VSNLKKVVEARMRETCETYQRALYYVKFNTPDRNKELQAGLQAKLDGHWKAALGPDNRQPSAEERQRYRDVLARSVEEFKAASLEDVRQANTPRIKMMRIA